MGKKVAKSEPQQKFLGKLDFSGLNTPECEKSRLILEYSHESAQALLNAFQLSRHNRGATSGTSTDEEQDLLRAMLVMAASGLDSATKQLVGESLPRLVEIDVKVRSGLEEFVRRSIRGDVEESDSRTGTAFLARVLSVSNQQRQVVEEYIKDLTKGSLQSHSELARTASALGLSPKKLGITEKNLKLIFEVRNKVIHELDINFTTPNRNRNPRGREKMMDGTNRLLQVGRMFVCSVDGRLNTELAKGK